MIATVLPPVAVVVVEVSAAAMLVALWGLVGGLWPMASIAVV